MFPLPPLLKLRAFQSLLSTHPVLLPSSAASKAPLISSLSHCSKSKADSGEESLYLKLILCTTPWIAVTPLPARSLISLPSFPSTHASTFFSAIAFWSFSLPLTFHPHPQKAFSSYISSVQFRKSQNQKWAFAAWVKDTAIHFMAESPCTCKISL